MEGIAMKMNLESAKKYAIQYASPLLIILISILSAFCTYNLTMAMLRSTATAIMITTIVEGGLILFAFKFFNHHRAYGFMWVGFLVFSIIASRGSIMDEINSRQEIKKVQSAEYIQTKADTTTLDKQLETLQRRLDALSTNNASSDNKGLQDVNKRLADKRTELSNTVATPKTQRKRNDLYAEIESLEQSKKELLNISSTLSESEAKKQKEVDAIYAQMKELNSSKNNLVTKTETIGGKNAFKESIQSTGFTEVVFWTIFFVFLEITRFILQREKEGFRNLFTPKNPPQNKLKKPELDIFTTEKKDTFNGKSEGLTCSKSNVIDFSKRHSDLASNKDFEDLSKKKASNEQELSKQEKSNEQVKSKPAMSKTDIEMYLEYMYANSKGGISEGYKKIARSIGIKETMAYKIKSHLEKLGVIKAGEKGTEIIAEKSQALLYIA